MSLIVTKKEVPAWCNQTEIQAMEDVAEAT
jgi:hypothetical protein